MQISVPPSICARCGKQETVQPTHLFRDKNTNEWRPSVVERPAGWMAWSKDQDLCVTCKETWGETVKAFFTPPLTKELGERNKKESDNPPNSVIGIIEQPITKTKPTFQAAPSPSPVTMSTASNPIPLHETKHKVSPLMSAAVKCTAIPIPRSVAEPIQTSLISTPVKPDPVNTSTIIAKAIIKPVAVAPPPKIKAPPRTPPSRRSRYSVNAREEQARALKSITPVGTTVTPIMRSLPAAPKLPTTIPIPAQAKVFTTSPSQIVSTPTKTTTISALPGAVKPPQSTKYE
jgi:hypothetical protein